VCVCVCVCTVHVCRVMLWIVICARVHHMVHSRKFICTSLNLNFVSLSCVSDKIFTCWDLIHDHTGTLKPPQLRLESGGDVLNGGDSLASLGIDCYSTIICTFGMSDTNVCVSCAVLCVCVSWSMCCVRVCVIPSTIITNVTTLSSRLCMGGLAISGTHIDLIK